MVESKGKETEQYERSSREVREREEGETVEQSWRSVTRIGGQSFDIHFFIDCQGERVGERESGKVLREEERERERESS